MAQNNSLGLLYRAYHEAGHVAAMAFTAQGFEQIVEVNVIASKRFLGVVRSRGINYARNLNLVPIQDQPTMARREAIWLLAGSAAEAKFEGVKFDVEQLAEEYVTCEDDGGEAIDMVGTDINIVGSMADKVSRRYYPKWRLIHTWAGLTVELLEESDVWSCVEHFAKHLAKVGTISENELEPFFAPIYMKGYESARWRRRLVLPSMASTERVKSTLR